ncbi:uncharacterized protein LOC144620654 [Crassostrea virginica]
MQRIQSKESENNIEFCLTITAENREIHNTKISSGKEDAVEQLIQISLEKLKEILGDHDSTKKALYTLRDRIQPMIDGCADNIKITIYLDDVLNGSIEIKAGQAENCLRITIKNNGDIIHNWTKTIEELTFECGKDEVHATIQKASGTLKHILRDHDATREALNTVRDEIQNEIEKYADNVKVMIYLDEVLDGSIEIRVGRAENQVRVSIKSNGEIKYYMKRTFLEKVWNTMR